MYFPIRVIVTTLPLVFKASSFAGSVVANDVMSVNEFMQNIITGYETDPQYQTARFLLLPISAAISVIPAIFVSVAAAKNEIVHKRNHVPEKFNFWHTLQHALLFGFATMYGFASGLCSSNEIGEISNHEPNPIVMYLASLYVAFAFAWGFNRIHSHEINDASDGKGAFTLTYLFNALKVVLKHPSILFPCVGEGYYIANQFFKWVFNNPDLKGYYDDYRPIFIGVSMIPAFFNLIEAYTYAKSVDREEQKRVAANVVNAESQSLLQVQSQAPVSCWAKVFKPLAFFAGVLHSVDHITGAEQMIKDLLFIATCSWVTNPKWVEEDSWELITFRTLTWFVIAGFCLKKSAEGFRDTLIQAEDRYLRQ